MKKFKLIVVLCSILAVFGCKKSATTEATVIAPSSDSMSYQIDASGLQPLRSGENLAIWIKIAPDTSWIAAPPPQLRNWYSDGSGELVGKFYSLSPLDSLRGVLITLELTPFPLTPGFPLASGVPLFDSSKSNVTISLDLKSILGDYSNLQGSLVFTSPLADTTAYNHEFYLMNMQGAVQTPSLLSLSALPVGWKYGLWVEDTNFIPHEYFFYGLFSSAQGHDSDSANDHYSYPGGWKPQSMNMPSGNIIVTLEPELYGDSLKFKGPSSFTLLEFQRIPFIVKDKNYPMTNISAEGIPSGTITLRKN